jgi:site-specific DNA recombinase
MKRDVVYARVSSEEQKRQDTIAGQISEVTKHCQGKNVVIGHVYRDEGISGSTMLSRRPEGAQLLRDAEAGEINTVYLWKFDRISRNLRDFLNLMDQLEKCGVQIVSVTQPLPPGPAGRMLVQLLGAFAELDRANITENMRRGRNAKVAAGGFPGGRFAFGYQIVGEQRSAKLVPHPKHAAIVRSMFEAYAKGKTCQDVADSLNQRGVPTSRGGTLWRPNSVLTILRNKTYAKDIVTAELFARVQVLLSGNQSKKMAHAKNDYLLRGKITCGICGLKYTGRDAYYACVGRHCARRLYGDTRKPCTAPLLRRADIEGAVWSRIAGFLRKPGAVLRELERQMAIESHPLRLATKLREAEKERTAQAAKLDRIQLLFIEGEITAEQRREQRERVTGATAAIDSRIEDLRKEQASQDTAAKGLAGAQAVLESLAGAADRPTPAQRRKAVETLLQGIEVGADGKCKIAFIFESEHARSANAYAPGYVQALLTIETSLPERSRARRTA